MSDIDHLFTPSQLGPRSWYDKLTGDAREWVDAVVDACIERGEMPVYARVTEELYNRFGVTVSHTTVGETLRRLVRSRG